MKWVFPVFTACHLCGMVSVAEPVQLAIADGGAFDVSYRLSTGPSISGRLDIIGDMLADFEIEDGAVTGFRFVSGNVAYSDTTGEAVLSTFPIVSKVRITTKDIVSDVFSNGTAGAVDAETGIISNTGHTLSQNRGTIKTDYIVAGLVLQSETRNLAAQPDVQPLVGTTVVSATLLGDAGYMKTYRIDFNHTRDETREEPVTIVDGTVRIREVGSFQAVGTVSVPGDDFIEWAVARGAPAPASMGVIGPSDGQPLILAYAFRATGDIWKPEFTFDIEQSQVSLDLPEEGLRAPVLLEFSGDMAAGSWLPVRKQDDSVARFGIGESGTVTMPMPATGKCFFRLSLAE